MSPESGRESKTAKAVSDSRAGRMRPAIGGLPCGRKTCLGPDYYGEIADGSIQWSARPRLIDPSTPPVRRTSLVSRSRNDTILYGQGTWWGMGAMIKHNHWCRSSFAIDDIGSLWLPIAVINPMTATNRPSADPYVLDRRPSLASVSSVPRRQIFGDGVASQTRLLLVE